MRPNSESEFRKSGIADLLRATNETFGLKNIHPLTASVLLGLKFAFPGELKNNKLLNSPDLLFFDGLTLAGLNMNDILDMETLVDSKLGLKSDTSSGKNSGKSSNLVHKLLDNWNIQMGRIYSGITENGKRERATIVTNYQREILFVERYARQKQSWSLSEVLEYREIMNAITQTSLSAALLGSKRLESRLIPIRQQEMSLSAVRRKYAWLVDLKPENETERKLCALFEIVMGMQVIDDWLDRDDDRQLMLTTIGTQTVEECNGDQKQARKKIDSLSKIYFQRAEDLGYTKAVVKTMELFFAGIKIVQHRIPNIIGGAREKMLYESKIKDKDVSRIA